MARTLSLLGILALALAEAAAVGYAVLPGYSDNYRAFYVDRSTGCLDRPVGGKYQLGTTIELARDRDAALDDILVCGIAGSLRDGAWLKGERARLRIADPPPNTNLALEFEAQPALSQDWPVQRMTVSANGEPVSTIEFAKAERETYRIDIPAAVVTRSSALELELTLADTRPSPTIPPDGQRNSIRFRWIRITDK